MISDVAFLNLSLIDSFGFFASSPCAIQFGSMSSIGKVVLIPYYTISVGFCNIYIFVDRVLKSYIEYLCGTENVECGVLLSTKTTFRIGGPAKFFVTVPDKEKLVKLISALNFIEEPYFIIGAGANVLASDDGFDGVVIKLGFDEIVDNGAFIYADAGASLGKVVHFARDKGLSGLEWAVGIPGTVGGAVCMNAGAHGGEMRDVVTMVDVLRDGKVETLDATKLDFGYRCSVFQNNRNWVVLGAYLYLKSGCPVEISKRMLDILEKRKGQPKEPNAGSIFKKPSDDFYVGKVVEQLGLKGYKIGGAQISKKHAGVIVNTGRARATDVVKLIEIIKEKVKEKYGVLLEEEIVRV